MLSHLPQDYIERYPDYILHPASFNLNPDKIVHFALGLGVSPKGNWHSTMYADFDGGKILKDYKEWLEIAWEIEENITFWVRILTYIGENKKYVFPKKLTADKFYVEIVDYTGKFTYGYGKEYINKVADSIDEVFEFMENNHLLSPFFFTENEKKHLKLNDYKEK
jgi:hypothetical protein